MPFGMVSGIGQGMGVLDGGGDHQREWAVLGSEFGASHCDQWGLCDAALPILLWAGLVVLSVTYVIFMEFVCWFTV